MNVRRALNYIGRRAKLFSVLIGALSFFALAALSLFFLMQMVIAKELQKQQLVIEKIDTISQDVGSLLQHLSNDGNTSCSPDNLAQLRRLLFLHHYAWGIGIYNSKNQLYCTSDVGLLPTPEPTNLNRSATHFRSAGFDIWLDAPAILFQGAVHITVVRLGSFDVVVTPHEMREVLDDYKGVIWFNNHRGLTPIKVNRSFSSEQLNRMAGYARKLGPGVHFNWQTGRLLVISRVSRGPYLFDANVWLENTLTLTDILSDSPSLTIMALGLPFLIGFLIALALSPRLLKYQTIKYKVKYLCSDEHIHCMYQPIINLETRAIVGCEVLMRLYDENNTYFPDQVIPAIIESGLTLQLDMAVTSKALSELGAHFGNKEGFKVAFNFFPRDLNEFERIHAHFQMLRVKYGTERLAINIEVTEHGFSGDDVLSQVERFKAAGYLVSVDDFGTGYSNLRIVSEIAPDFLKIDKSFVFDMEDTSVRSCLIPEIISIARSVRAEVIAEGIENEEQELRLRAMGADYGQGYFYAKPMPIADFVALYRKQ